MNENKFEFTYKAPTESERRTVEAIKSQYEERTEADGDYEKLLKLDRRVKNIATIPSLAMGIIGTLIFGTGMAMVLEWNLIAWGIVVALVGAIPMASAPFFNKYLLKKAKKKYGDEIIRLSEKILKTK